MKTQFDNQADIPNGDKADFEEFEQDGKTVWMHKDLTNAYKIGYQHQGQLRTLKKQISTDKETALANFQKEKQEALEKQEAELTDKINNLRTDGDNIAANKLQMQSLEDKLKNAVDGMVSLQEENQGLKNAQVEKANLSYAVEIASAYTTPKGVGSLSQLLVANHIKNENGKPLFTNASGDAVDNDMDRIMDILNNSDLSIYSEFPGSKAGYPAKGGNTDGRKGKWSDYTPPELSAILRTDPKRYEALKDTR